MKVEPGWLGRIPSLVVVLAACASLFSMQAQAVPSFARQTDLPCSACHEGNFPALNSFGRQFKLNGYVMTTTKKIDQSATSSSSQLSLLSIPQISEMVQISATHTQTAQPGQQNNDTAFPQQASLFIAGRLAPHTGMFMQMTYSQNDGSFGIDNTDIRSAYQTMLGENNLTYGVDLNNNPTVEDLWNSTPVWGFPWASSDTAPGAAAAPFIGSDAVGTNVTGLGAYAMLDNTYYADLAFYRSTHNNAVDGSTATFKNAAPYWRLAWQHNFGASELMVGTYGMYAKVYPTATANTVGGGISGPVSTYFDRAVDFQYSVPLSENSHFLTVHGSFTDEGRKDLAGDGTYLAGHDSTWKSYRIDADYNLTSHWQPILAYFNTNTNGDGLDNSGFIGQINFIPWQNLNLSLQYQAFQKFDGSSHNASDNNSLYLLAWLVL